MLLIAKIILNWPLSRLIFFLSFFSIYYNDQLSLRIQLFPFISSFLLFPISISVKSSLSFLTYIKAIYFSSFTLDLHFIHFEWSKTWVWSQVLFHDRERENKTTEAVHVNQKGERKKEGEPERR